MTRPRLLLLALNNWVGPARLPGALRDAGFEVGLLSEPGNVAAQSRHVDRHFPVSVARIRHGRLRPVWRAIEAFAPDFIVPVDDGAVRLAQHLADAKASPALRRSLGDAAWFAQRGSRARMQVFAAGAGLTCPANAVPHDLQDALAFGALHGWPIFLKRDHGSGGLGVRLCPDAAATQAAFTELNPAGHRPWSPRGLWRRGRTLARLALFGPDPLVWPEDAGISVEAGVSGQPAFHTAVALNGRYLAGISAEVEAFHPHPTGPSTRVRLHHDSEMEMAARRLIGALGYSGFCGLDFIRRADGTLVFLEFNQRPTPVAHLGAMIDADLCAALFSALAGQECPNMASALQARVALFPQDWVRDPRASDREGLTADFPSDDPALLAALSARIDPAVRPSLRAQ